MSAEQEPAHGSASEAAVPEPPWRRAPQRRRPPRQPLTRDAIVGTALEVLDREGLDAFSMRRVAEELGTGAASLYWHVSDKQELLDLVFDRVIGEVGPLPPPDPDRWQEQLEQLARTARRVLLRHRDITRLALDRWPMGPNALLFAEGLLGILRAGGLPDRVCAWATGLLPSFVGWFVLEEQLGRQSPAPPDDTAADYADLAGMVHDYLVSLPPERFPNLLAVVDELTGGDHDERFDFGIGVLLRGLDAHTQA